MLQVSTEDAVKNRHTVRKYLDKKIEGEVLDNLNSLVKECNEEGGLHIQLITDEPEAFSGLKSRMVKSSGVANYVALVGKESDKLDVLLGYYGEKIVIRAAELGLNSWWVALTFSRKKTKCVIDAGEKLVCVIALGYGAEQGSAHKVKDIGAVSKVDGEMPEWFKKGMEYALLAPTALNQQKFMFELSGNKVTAKSLGGSYSNVDLGIAKYHFEIGAGKENFEWA